MLFLENYQVIVEEHVEAVTRSAHVAVRYDNHLLVWGGYRESIRKLEYCDPSKLWMYNALNEVWTCKKTVGDIPPECTGACGVIHGDFLYIFGGFSRFDPNSECIHSNRLYRLDLKIGKWDHIRVEGVEPLPCDKLVGWAHREKLYFFGGFGPPMRNTNLDSNLTFVYDFLSERGWNNQFVCFDTRTNSWECPHMRGSRPPPRAAHSAAKSGNTVYIFGGRLKSIRNDDLYSFCLDTMTWSGNLKSIMRGSDWPCGRSWNTFNFISPSVAIIHGGFSTTNVELDDFWQMTFRDSSIECQKYPTYNLRGGEVIPILWHQSAYFPQTDEIVTIGGMKTLTPTVGMNHCNHRVFILHFSPKSLLRLCLDVLEKLSTAKPDHELKLSAPAELLAIIERRSRKIYVLSEFYR